MATYLRAIKFLAAVVIAVVAAVCWIAVTAAPAAAHAELVRSTPAQGAHLDRAPDQVVLVFTDAVRPVNGGMRVLDGRGRVVAEPSPHHDPAEPDTVRLAMPDLGDGVYAVAWRVVSADTHPVRGAVTFTVGAAAKPAAPLDVGSTDDMGLRAAAWAARWAGYAGLMLLVGGAVFGYALWPTGRGDRRARGLLRTGAAVGAAGAAGVLLTQGPRAAGTSLAGVVEPRLLFDTIRSEFGTLLVLRLMLLAGLAVVASRLWRGGPAVPRAATAGLGVALAVPLLFTYAAVGHARSGDRVSLAVTSDMVHLAAVCVWVGGLVYLSGCLLLPRRTGDLAAVLPRFSRTAASCVAVLVATGIYQAWRELPGWGAFVDTSYGRVLTAKLTAFCVLLTLAAVARSVVQRRYVRPVAYALDPPAGGSVADDVAEGRANEAPPRRDPLRRAVAVETGIAMVVLALTAALVATPPGASASSGSAHEPAAAGPYSDTLRLPDGSRLEVRLTPARPGSNTLTVDVLRPDGTPRELPELSARLRLPDRDLGPLAVPLTEDRSGAYHAEPTIPVAGTWHLDLTARTTDIDAHTVSTTIPVR